MFLRRFTLLTIAVALSFSTMALGQGPGMVIGRPQGRTGPRDATGPQTGTARLRGRVVGGESGLPLRRAVVRLYGNDLREGHVATTDEDGRWEMKDLPAGRFNLSASKGGYVQLQYGQRRPFEQGRPIEVAQGQTLDNVNFNLPRGSVISGRIVDEFGEPVAEAMVNVLRYQYFNGQRRLVPVGRMDVSDDDGRFRVYGLSPGDYFVSATLRTGGMMERGDAGSYAATYYPGTGVAQQADRVSVGLGAETSGINFALMPVRTVKISGTAMDSQGRPMAGAFVMVREDMRRGETVMMMFGGGGTRVQDDGTFTISNVSPGDYVLEARPMGAGRPRGADDEQEVGFATVSVGSEDVAGVSLVGTKGTSIRGHVVLEPAAAANGPKPSEFSIFSMPKSPDAPMMFLPNMNRERLDDDWTFEIRAVQSPVVLRAGMVPSGYSLKSVVVNGNDVTDSGVAFRPGDPVTGVQIVFTTRSSRVTGTATDDKGQAAADYVVALFAEDRAKWGFMSRYQQIARPDQSAGFEVRNLPSGRYLAVALDALEDGQIGDPELLERLRPLATPFTLAEGEQKSVTLKVVQAY